MKNDRSEYIITISRKGQQKIIRLKEITHTNRPIIYFIVYRFIFSTAIYNSPECESIIQWKVITCRKFKMLSKQEINTNFPMDQGISIIFTKKVRGPAANSITGPVLTDGKNI